MKDCEFEFLPEDLRHFNIGSAKDLANFIEKLRVNKMIGFKPKEEKKKEEKK